MTFLLLWWLIFQMLSLTSISQVNLIRSWWISLLTFYWIQFATNLLSIFSSMVHEWHGLFVFFLVISLSGDIKVMLASYWMRSFYFLTLWKTGVVSSLNVCKNWPINSSGPGIFFIEKSFIYRFNFLTKHRVIQIFYFFQR